MTRSRAPGRAARRLGPPARLLRRWAHARAGVAAVEFALIVPVMLFLYLGMTEVSFLVNTNRKVDLASRTIGDLTGRATTLDANGLLSIMNAAEAVMTPFSTTGLTITVSSVRVTPTSKDSQGQVTSATGAVTWSCSRQSSSSLGAGLAKGTAVAVPPGFESAQSFVQTTVRLPYAPLFGSAIFQKITGQSGMNLDETMSWPVRDAGEVGWTGSGTCS